jgi:hypothetical protein
MNADEITSYILDTFAGVQTVTADGNTFFFYDPDHMFPFVTLVSNDAYDQASNLSRPSVFRLNIGIGKQTYQALFGAPAAPSDVHSGGARSYDFTALDQVMPHPIYGRQYWVCVLNPGAATFEGVVQPLLAEAYQRDVDKHTRRKPHTGEPAAAQPSGTGPASDFPAGLAQPALRALNAAGYTHLEQLAGVTESELLKLHGMGAKALGLIRSALQSRGLSFADAAEG